MIYAHSTKSCDMYYIKKCLRSLSTVEIPIFLQRFALGFVNGMHGFGGALFSCHVLEQNMHALYLMQTELTKNLESPSYL